MSVGAQMVVVLKAIVEILFRSSSVIPSNFPGSRYPKQMYLIDSSYFPSDSDFSHTPFPFNG
jgi:hypothetical protein